jgi:hypothetical protein
MTSIREIQLLKVQQEGFQLFQKKNKDYGDAFAKYGPVGVLMRMGDKLSRLQSITKSGITLVDDEKVRDTLIDLHNYSAMAIMLLDEGKPIDEVVNSNTESELDELSETTTSDIETSEEKLTFDYAIYDPITFEKLYNTSTNILKGITAGLLMIFIGNAFQITAHNIFYKNVKV